MDIRICAFIATMFCGSIPLLANADVVLANNTNNPGTAHWGFFCSSDAGDNGVIGAHGKLTVTADELKDLSVFCSKSCNATIYMSSSCKGDKVATITFNTNDGITSVENYHVDGYVVSGSGMNGSIDGGPAPKWYDMFLRFFK